MHNFLMMGVDQGVTAADPDQPPVDRKSGDERKHQ
jgi:hypothetical protein